MKSFLILLTLLAFPFSMQAKHNKVKDFNQPLTHHQKQKKPVENINCDKETLIRFAYEQYDQAIVELNKAQNICWYIPDFNNRSTISALIAGTVASSQARDPRAAILAIALPILAAALNNMHEKYCEIRDCFIQAERHLEMARVYNDLSFRTKSNNTDEGTRIFFVGIDYLTAAIVLAQSGHPTTGRKDNQDWLGVVNVLNYYRQEFIKDQADIGYRGEWLHESMPEIAISFEENFRREIQEYVYLMALKFAEAEKTWYYAKKKKK